MFIFVLKNSTKAQSMVVQVLMVAEKPSLAKSLAHILSGGHMTSSTESAVAVHRYMGTFQHSRAEFAFTSVCGHVYSLDFLPQYNNWCVH